jgi:PIN domain nuclease of toxin-antitoxin system
MRLLLDTHTLLWYDSQKSLLSEKALELIQDRANEVYVSSVTAWELAIKWKQGKLPSAQTLVHEFHSTLSVYGFLELPLNITHGLRAGTIDATHKDPFGRALAAQALSEQLQLVSKDDLLDGFGVSRIW